MSRILDYRFEKTIAVNRAITVLSVVNKVPDSLLDPAQVSFFYSTKFTTLKKSTLID